MSNRGGGGRRRAHDNERGLETHHAIRLDFKVTKKEVEYEVMLTRLAIVETSRERKVEMKADSQVVVGQVTREYFAKSEN